MTLTRNLTLALTALISLAGLSSVPAQDSAPAFEQGRVVDAPGAVLAWRSRVAPVNAALEDRLHDLLPRLMRQAGIDLWLVINREYAEDPVYMTLVPEPVFAARRTTMLVLHDRGARAEERNGEDGGLELLTVSRYPLGDPYEAAWEGGDEEEQWRGLAEVIRARNPRRSGIDVSRDWPVADGHTASLSQALRQSPLSSFWMARSTSASVNWAFGSSAVRRRASFPSRS